MPKEALSAMEPLSLFTLPKWEEIPDLGLYMDQVLTYFDRLLTPLSAGNERIFTSSMINNYVKMNLLSRPMAKKYSRDHLSRLLMLAILKQSATAEEMRVLFRTPESASPCEAYESFRHIYFEASQELSEIPPFSSPMHYALRASSYRLLFRTALGRNDKEPSHLETEERKTQKE